MQRSLGALYLWPVTPEPQRPMAIQTAERSSAQDASENPIYQRHMAAYLAAVPYMKGSVLELGCGEGYGMALLAKHCDQYLGVDKHPVPNLHIPPQARVMQATFPRWEVSTPTSLTPWSLFRSLSTWRMIWPF